MRKNDLEPHDTKLSLRRVILDAAGAVSLFVLFFAVLHLPVMT